MYCPMVFTVWWSLAHLSDVQSPDLLGATLNPYIFHAANLVVHWLCACVVLEILLRLKIRGWAAAAGAIGVCGASAPDRSSRVGIGDEGFAERVLRAAVRSGDTSPRWNRGGKKRRWNYWLSTIFFAAALLSKPSTVVRAGDRRGDRPDRVSTVVEGRGALDLAVVCDGGGSHGHRDKGSAIRITGWAGRCGRVR